MDAHTSGESLPVATDTLGRRIVPRRHRTVEEKVRIVEESLHPGASGAEVARRHDINANLLFTWRRQHEQGLLGRRTRRVAKDAAKLVPVKVREGISPVTGSIEIELERGVRVRVLGEAAPRQIEAVLRVLTAEER
jgi:transposase